MKICYLNNYYYIRGGAERVMCDEGDLLRKAGHQVSFFSQRHPLNFPCEDAEYYPPYIDPTRLSPLGRLRHAPRIAYNVATYRRLQQFVQAESPQLFHAHNIYGGLTTAVFDLAARYQIPAVMTVHDYKLICPSYLSLNHGHICERCLGGRFYHCLLTRCHKSNLAASLTYCAESYFNRWFKKYATVRYLISPSRFMADRLLANHFAPERVLYMPNAIAADRITPALGGGAYALYTGRLSPEKGLFTLLRAVAPLDLPLGIAGDGPLRPALEAFVDEHHLHERVTFHGYQTGEALQQLYQQAAFCVVPSEWYENAPMTVLEAFAYGKPVIGANIGGIPEMIEHGKTGLLFPAGDVDALRACLETLWRQRATWGEMGAAAREVVLRDFSYERHSEALLEIYRRALGSSPAHVAH